MHPMKDSTASIRANWVMEPLISVIVCVYAISAAIAFPRLLHVTVYTICRAALNQIAVLLLHPLKMTSVCPKCENAELRISHKQYILHTLSKIKRDSLRHNKWT
jgi:hypothetical protein